MVFLIATAAIGVFKKEVDASTESEEGTLGLIDTYKALWKMIKHPMLFKMMVFLTTYGLGVSAAEYMSNLKLIEKGCSKRRNCIIGNSNDFRQDFCYTFCD